MPGYQSSSVPPGGGRRRRLQESALLAAGYAGPFRRDSGAWLERGGLGAQGVTIHLGEEKKDLRLWRVRVLGRCQTSGGTLALMAVDPKWPEVTVPAGEFVADLRSRVDVSVRQLLPRCARLEPK